MLRDKRKQRGIAVTLSFIFLLFHGVDLIRLSPISSQVIATLNIDQSRFQAVIVAGIIVGGVLIPVWGVFHDSHSRVWLLAMAGFIWGATSLLVAIAPTYATFAISYVSSAIDYAGGLGIYSLMSDLFSPRNRGKIYGLLISAQPLAYLLSTVFLNQLWMEVNWRLAVLGMAMVGFVMAALIRTLIREPRRGQMEPALKDLTLTGKYIFDWRIARRMLMQPGMWLLYGVGFFASIPWAVNIRWMMPYLNSVRGLPLSDIYLVGVPPMIGFMLGLPLGGFMGDRWTRANKRARPILGALSIGLAGLFYALALQIRDALSPIFMVLLALTCFISAFERPNVLAMIADVTLPELRSTAFAVWMLGQLGGSLLGGWLVGAMVERTGLGQAMLAVCLIAWAISLALMLGLALRQPKDIETLRKKMAYRSWLEGRVDRPGQGKNFG